MIIENLTLFPCNSALDFRPRFFFIGCWSSSFLSLSVGSDTDFSTVFISSGISEDDGEIWAWCLVDTASSCFLSREAFLRRASIVFNIQKLMMIYKKTIEYHFSIVFYYVVHRLTDLEIPEFVHLLLLLMRDLLIR